MGCGSGFYVRALRAREVDCDGCGSWQGPTGSSSNCSLSRFDGHEDTETLTGGLCYCADFAFLAWRLASLVCLRVSGARNTACSRIGIPYFLYV